MPSKIGSPPPAEPGDLPILDCGELFHLETFNDGFHKTIVTELANR